MFFVISSYQSVQLLSISWSEVKPTVYSYIFFCRVCKFLAGLSTDSDTDSVYNFINYTISFPKLLKTNNQHSRVSEHVAAGIRSISYTSNPFQDFWTHFRQTLPVFAWSGYKCVEKFIWAKEIMLWNHGYGHPSRGIHSRSGVEVAWRTSI